MPDKPLTVLTYAASASLAAIALIYFFNPNHLIDSETSTSSASSRKKGVVGLVNPANDCFINCILQSLAGLGDLRLYLIREVHRRQLSDPAVYTTVPVKDKDGKDLDIPKLASLQGGGVTQGLKLMIDALNERPIHKKTISASQFIRVLENAFGSRISKAQQDAQELLQIVAERLAEEYHAGTNARKRASQSAVGDTRRSVDDATNRGSPYSVDIETGNHDREEAPDGDAPEIEFDVDSVDDEMGFPLEGKTEAGIECSYCHFRPKPNITSFVMLNLMVPQKSSTTLNDCFDAHFKREHIDDYTCDQCRLGHALDVFGQEVFRVKSEAEKAAIREKIAKVQVAYNEDPEHPPKDVQLPNIKSAPKRRISRHVQITTFPRILVIHLSRSVFDSGSISTKNLAKVSFPEKLPLGGLLNRRNYKLLGMVTHRGTHNSGHYEAFRRQHLYAPYSTPHRKRPSGPYTAISTPESGYVPSPRLPAQAPNTSDAPLKPYKNLSPKHAASPSAASSDPSVSSNSRPSASTRPSSSSDSGAPVSPSPPGSPEDAIKKGELSSSEQPNLRVSREKSIIEQRIKGSSIDFTRLKRKKKASDRWWRISDDKIKECSTEDVLAMQKDVYMLFYEMDRDD